MKAIKSWKTTALGIIGAVIMLLTQVQAVLDSDPNTVFSWEAFTVALGLLGVGWFARDNDKTSEDVGSNKTPEGGTDTDTDTEDGS